MSENLLVEREKIDPRVRRTRDRLGDALVGLMHEKPFDSITVQHVLDRAGVSRSTFYQHYRDKNDLFLSDSEEFYESVSMALSRRRESSDRVAPVRELFAHVAEARRYLAALVASGRFHDSFELARGHFARGIERRLSEIPRGRSIPRRERRAIAHAASGALLALLTWWIDSGTPDSPAAMDRLFHRLVWSGATPCAAAAGPAGRPR